MSYISILCVLLYVICFAVGLGEYNKDKFSLNLTYPSRGPIFLPSLLQRRLPKGRKIWPNMQFCLFCLIFDTCDTVTAVAGIHVDRRQALVWYSYLFKRLWTIEFSENPVWKVVSIWRPGVNYQIIRDWFVFFTHTANCFPPTGPIPMMIGAELFRQGPRPRVMSLAGLTNWLFTMFVALTFELIQVSRMRNCYQQLIDITAY